MSNFHTGNSGFSNGATGSSGSNSNAFVSRRDIRASNPTGALPVIGAGRGYTSYTSQSGHTGSFDFEAMLLSLHELFEHDRQVASQQEARRCGICYLHFLVSELYYREEEGLYVCQGCDRAASKQQLPMLRRQQK